MTISLTLQNVRKIVLGVPRQFDGKDSIGQPFVWQSVTFHLDDGQSVTVDCCQQEVDLIPVEVRKSYKLLDAINHHTAVQLREMDPAFASVVCDPSAASEGQ